MAMSHTLLSTDPGKCDAGVALYGAGKLVECAFIAPKDGTPYNVVLGIEAWLVRALRNHTSSPDPKVNDLIVEGQQIYPGLRRENPNDLLPLAQVVGGVLSRIQHYRHQIILPRVWTGGKPKEVRIRHFIGGASEEEKQLLSNLKAPGHKKHNVIDAICLGAYALKRLPDVEERSQ